MARQPHPKRVRQSPGAGLPEWERMLLNAVFKFGCAFQTDRAALQAFLREADQLTQLVENDRSYDVFQEVLIPRITGIEDSSREWSLMMTLDHLCRTNQAMMGVINALIEGIEPLGEVKIAAFKPDPDIGFEVLERFKELTFQYYRRIEQLLSARRNLRTPMRFAHPWFGLLDAHQWHCLAAAHQKIHRRQAQKIVAMLGVT